MKQEEKENSYVLLGLNYNRITRYYQNCKMLISVCIVYKNSNLVFLDLGTDTILLSVHVKRNKGVRGLYLSKIEFLKYSVRHKIVLKIDKQFWNSLLSSMGFKEW